MNWYIVTETNHLFGFFVVKIPTLAFGKYVPLQTCPLTFFTGSSENVKKVRLRIYQFYPKSFDSFPTTDCVKVLSKSKYFGD